MQSTTLGRGGPVVSRMGLGMMGMSGIYGPADDTESIATIRAAIDAGITLLDTGDFYGMGHNEMLLGSALREVPRDSVFVQVKFGAQRDPAGGYVGHDASPAAVKTSLAYSLRRLGTDYVDLYQPARLDPNVPIEDTVGAIAEMITAGYVRYAGLSEMGAGTIRRAQAVHPIAALQTEYSLWSREPEDEILPTCRELGIGFVAYSPLGRGFLTGRYRKIEDVPADDYRRHSPRFQGENFGKNLDVVGQIERIAGEKNVTPSQLALAWLLKRGEDIVPIPGTKRRSYLEENVAAAELKLSAAENERLKAAFPLGVTAGTRYPEKQLKALGI